MYCNNNNNNNNNNNEILFWKIFRNKYIRNNILSKLNTNSNNKSYNNTTSLQLMVSNNKLDMIIDKLESNHYVYFYRLQDSFDSSRVTLKDPFHKVKMDEIYRLLWLNYSNHIIRIQSEDIEFFKLWYSGGFKSKIGFKNCTLYELFYGFLNDGKLEFVKNLRNVIGNNNNNDNNNHNNQNDQQEFINQLKSDSLTLEESIKDAIYNDKQIPISSYYSVRKEIKYLIYQDFVKGSSLDIDFKQILLQNNNFVLYNCGNNKEILELVYLTLLYRDSTIQLTNLNYKTPRQHFDHYQVNNILHAKIYILNQINRNRSRYEIENRYSKFKQYLKENKVETLDELISVANETFIIGYEDKLGDYLADFYYYFYLVSKYSNNQNFKNNNLPSPRMEHQSEYLIIHCSVINQSIEAFKNEFLSKYEDDKHNGGFISKEERSYSRNWNSNRAIEKELSMTHKEREPEGRFKIKQSNSVGFGFGSDNSDDELIKEKSAKFFNDLIEVVNNSPNIKPLYIWYQVFKCIIYNYNSNLFDWLLSSNPKLRNIYYKLTTSQDNLFGSKYSLRIKMFLAHTRIIQEGSNQINNEMFNVYIKHINFFNINPVANIPKFISDRNLKIQSHQLYISLLNHLLESQSNNYNYFNNSFFRSLVKRIVIEGLSSGNNVDRIIQSYNQVNQELLSNYFKNNNGNDKDDKDESYKKEVYNNKVLAYNNKTSILVPILIQSIINLDYESINKIISATLNNNNESLSIIKTLKTINNSPSIIKYLISKHYLKEFNIYYVIIEFINHVKVNKNFIFFLLILAESTHLRPLLEEYYNNLELLRQQVKKVEKREFQGLEKEFLNLNNEGTFQTISELTFNQLEDPYIRNFFSKKIDDYIRNGYYSSAYNFLNKYSIDIDVWVFSLLDLSWTFQEHPISVECFSKLYPVLLKKLIKSNKDIYQICSYNPEIFEFMWTNHFKNDKERIDFVMDYDNMMISSSTLQLAEYIFNSKRRFILKLVHFNRDQLFHLHSTALIDGNISIFKQVRLLYPSFKFKINFSIIERLINFNCLDAMEYLNEKHLIEDLEQIIGKGNIDNLKIRGIDRYGFIQVSHSMFILIHSIIKQQQQYQLQNKITKIKKS